MTQRRSIWSMTSASTPAASRLGPCVSYCGDVCCHACYGSKDHEPLGALTQQWWVHEAENPGPLLTAGMVGGFAGGERGVQQYVEKGEVEVAEQGGSGLASAVLQHAKHFLERAASHSACVRLSAKPVLQAASSHRRWCLR